MLVPFPDAVLCTHPCLGLAGRILWLDTLALAFIKAMTDVELLFVNTETVTNMY